jgi:hypothetical protein
VGGRREAGAGHVDVGVIGEVVAADERAEDLHTGSPEAHAQELRGLAGCISGARTAFLPPLGRFVGAPAERRGVDLDLPLAARRRPPSPTLRHRLTFASSGP